MVSRDAPSGSRGVGVASAKAGSSRNTSATISRRMDTPRNSRRTLGPTDPGLAPALPAPEGRSSTQGGIFAAQTARDPAGNLISFAGTGADLHQLGPRNDGGLHSLHRHRVRDR